MLSTQLIVNLGKYFPHEKLCEAKNNITLSEEKQNETHQKPALAQNEIFTIAKNWLKVNIHHRQQTYKGLK